MRNQTITSDLLTVRLYYRLETLVQSLISTSPLLIAIRNNAFVLLMWASGFTIPTLGTYWVSFDMTAVVPSQRQSLAFVHLVGTHIRSAS